MYNTLCRGYRTICPFLPFSLSSLSFSLRLLRVLAASALSLSQWPLYQRVQGRCPASHPRFLQLLVVVLLAGPRLVVDLPRIIGLDVFSPLVRARDRTSRSIRSAAEIVANPATTTWPKGGPTRRRSLSSALLTFPIMRGRISIRVQRESL